MTCFHESNTLHPVASFLMTTDTDADRIIDDISNRLLNIDMEDSNVREKKPKYALKRFELIKLACSNHVKCIIELYKYDRCNNCDQNHSVIHVTCHRMYGDCFIHSDIVMDVMKVLHNVPAEKNIGETL